MQHPQAVTDVLNRHHARRAAGVPTVTAFDGPPGLGLRTWRAWADAHARPVSVARGAALTDALVAWVDAALTVAPLADRASAWLGPRSPAPGATRYDLEQLRNALPLDTGAPVAVAAFRALFDRAAGTATGATELVAELGPRAVRALADLYPEPQWPALVLLPPAGAPDDWPLRAAGALERFATAEPRTPVAVAAGDLERVVALRPESRAAALLREGRVTVASVSASELVARFRAAGLPVPDEGAVARLVNRGLAPESAEALIEATRAAAAAAAAPPAAESEFRSGPEAFLFDLLETLPETAGLFRPNRALGFDHGGRAAEADLVCDRLKIAVELDGSYYHLNQEQYRRDRRKDILYQQHGYFVLRFLSEDVLRAWEPVLEVISEAVTLRRAARPPNPTGAA